MDTQNYKRTVAGSVGSGMGAVFGSGKTYYILEHKTSSKFHQAGEAQKIIVDQIEMGRDASCQVRFDESFETVSRKHAAINRDGDKWQLVHLSQSNPTLVNGQAINGTYTLKSGDEIQLSVNGPRMGFIIPQGGQALTSSIAMSERVSLFSKQALRPYRTALWIIALLLLAVIAGAVYWANQMKEANRALQSELEMKADIEAPEVINPSSNLHDYYSQIYTLKPQKITIEYDGISTDAGIAVSDIICGTGFMLADGTFVTARQNIEPWIYAGIVEGAWRERLAEFVAYGCKVNIEYRAYNLEGTAHPLTFTNKDFIIDTKGVNVTRKVELSDAVKKYLQDNGIELPDETVEIEDVISTKSHSYAYIPGKGTKGLPFDVERSKTITDFKEITVLGFKGNPDIHQLEESISYFSVGAVDFDKNVNLGYLGSPAFYRQPNGIYTVIGIMTGNYNLGEYKKEPIEALHTFK
ncbi:MAG: FHA domain-containing protein [Bacteroidaceae bacterium]|nr:FHA domain-containing protein [Bacteroidaceae bacterium]